MVLSSLAAKTVANSQRQQLKEAIEFDGLYFFMGSGGAKDASAWGYCQDKSQLKAASKLMGPVYQIAQVI